MQRNRQNQRQKRGGFTLLEVMIVLFILVTIGALMIFNVQAARERAHLQTAKAYVLTLRNAVDQYDATVGYPPTAEQGGLAALITCPANLTEAKWGGPYIHDTVFLDPWRNEYQYASPPSRSSKSRNFEIWSFGPDREDGTEDDVNSWEI